jgi:hypothetical protein
VTGSAGITITVSDVTIDLNGFTVSGVGKTAGGTATGIVGINDTTARNGRVKDWAGDGIRLGAGVTLEDLNVVNVGGACIKTSEQAQVRHCRVGLGDQGIVVGDSSVVESAISISNSGASPKSGIAMGAYGVITNCTSSYNAGQGILVGNGSSLSNLTASNNSGTTGIVALDGSTFTNCASFLNSGNGIKAGFGSTLIGCTAKSNALDGIAPGDGSTLSKCTVRENRHNGINIDSACTLDGNTAQSNGLAGTNSTGFAGIRVTGAGNRIDGNHFTFHNFKNFAIGMYVTGTGNLIIRNTSHGNNADYIIGSDNRYGPIIDITAAGTVAVLGRSATDTTTTTHPWANFVY